MALLSAPPQYEWEYRCACGNKKPGGVSQGNSCDMAFYMEWKKYNKGFKDILRSGGNDV